MSRQLKAKTKEKDYKSDEEWASHWRPEAYQQGLRSNKLPSKGTCLFLIAA
jgi:hypothetical protein